MKRLCFGTLLNLIYQARSSGVTYKSICDAVFSAYGCNDMSVRDKTLPSKLRSGDNNVPPDVINAARSIPYDKVLTSFDKLVTVLIARENDKSFIYAIKAILDEDNTIGDDTIVGYVPGFEKKNIISSRKFIMTSMLASVLRYAIVEVVNADCKNNLSGFEKNYLTIVKSSVKIFIDPFKPNDNINGTATSSAVLQRTVNDASFINTFHKIDTVTVAGTTHPSTANIYCGDLNNCVIRFGRIKEFIVDHIGTYVFSRQKNDRLSSRSKGAVGTRALIEFQKAYGKSAGSVLGELLLYVFLEHELNAPKVMSKIEFSQNSGMVSKSDGIHLLATKEFGKPFNQLVFGASDIQGNLVNAVDRAFERIVEIEKNHDAEYNTVESTPQNLIFDNDVNEYILDIMTPRKQYTHKPDMAFGVFLGYTLNIAPPVSDAALHRIAAEQQLKKDIADIKDYIYKKMKDLHLDGYTFYCYILPFNNAPVEKTGLIDEILEGR